MTPRNMYVIDNEIHLLGRGYCEPLSCLHYYVLSLDGEVLRTSRYPEISPALYSTLIDSTIYIGGRFIEGDTIEKRDGYRVFELNLKGDLINTIEYSQNNLENPPGYAIESYIPIGAIANYDENSTAEDYRTIVRYDSEANELFRWEPPELTNELNLFIPLLVTSDDDYITHITNESNSIGDDDLICITNQGELNWRKRLRFSFVDVGSLALFEMSDGNFLSAGLSEHATFRAAHISKYNIETGDVIWDRVVLDWEDETRPTARTTFFCVEELDDGSIIASQAVADWSSMLQGSQIISHI